MQQGPKDSSKNLQSDDLPEMAPELWNLFFSYLDPRSLANASMISKEIGAIADDPLLWRPYLERLQRIDQNVPITPPLDAPLSWSRVTFIENFKRIAQEQYNKLLKISENQKKIEHLSGLNPPPKIGDFYENNFTTEWKKGPAANLLDLELRHDYFSPENMCSIILTDTFTEFLKKQFLLAPMPNAPTFPHNTQTHQLNSSEEQEEIIEVDMYSNMDDEEDEEENQARPSKRHKRK